MEFFDTTTLFAGKVQLSGPRAPVFEVVKAFGVLPVGTDVCTSRLALTRLIDVTGSTEDFVQNPLHQKWICNLLMTIILVQEFLAVSNGCGVRELQF